MKNPVKSEGRPFLAALCENAKEHPFVSAAIVALSVGGTALVSKVDFKDLCAKVPGCEQLEKGITDIADSVRGVVQPTIPEANILQTCRPRADVQRELAQEILTATQQQVSDGVISALERQAIIDGAFRAITSYTEQLPDPICQDHLLAN